MPSSLSMPMTKYHQIFLVLREQLVEGRFSSGLPGEMALMQQFGVARVRFHARCTVKPPRL